MALRKKQSKAKISGQHLITRVNPRSSITEQYRTVRTNLQFSSIDQELRRLMVTSSRPGEGKSSTVANLAVVFAQQGKKVLVIDGDMRKPTIHYLFGLDNRNGLSNVLVGDTTLNEAVNTGGDSNLKILTCGPIPPNPSELLGSKAMERLLTEAETIYDLVIIDSPPVLLVTDGQILANHCDGVVLVVRSKKTEYESVRKSRDLLNPARAKMLGIILNDHESEKTEYYYGLS